jgi:hypothetical protein
MRHLVNFGLLFTFVALAVTGLLAFSRPFSLTTTQVHIVAGLLMVALVVLHIGSRIPYFQNQFEGKKKGTLSKVQLAGLLVIVGGLIFLAGNALPPASWLVGLGYEARHKAEIVRTSSLSGFGEIGTHSRLVTRIPKDGVGHGLSLYIRFNKDLETLPAIAVWAETNTGSMIETLHLEQSLAYSDKPLWHEVNEKRNHILPVWRNRYTMVSGVSANGVVDAVTRPTENHKFALDPHLQPGKDNKFLLWVEVNAPNDANAAWRGQRIGQPSVLYSAYVKIDEAPPYTILELTAHGGGAADNGTLDYDLDSLTTAKDLVDLMLLKLEPAK